MTDVKVKVGEYPKVLVPEPCHKIASLILQDASFAIFGDLDFNPSGDLLELLHQIARTLDEIPEFKKATDLRLRANLAINKATK